MAGMAAVFSTREAVRLTGLSTARIRTCVRAGMVRADEARAAAGGFSFSDLLLLKTTKRLLDAGVPLVRIRRAFSLLQRHGHGDAITRLAISANGRRVVAANRGVRWQADSGQLELRFEAPAPASRLAALERRAPAQQHSPDQWYELGTRMEATSVGGAMEAYRQALAMDADFVEAHINLGRLFHVTGKLHNARAHYTRALQLDALDPIPAFNLGVVLEDLGQPDEAMKMYRAAVRRDPQLVDAHYNLALLCERNERYFEALKHLRAYEKLVRPHSGGAS